MLPNLPKSSNISGTVTRENNKRSNKYLSVRLCVLYLYLPPCPPMYLGVLKHFLVLKGLVLPFRPSFVNRWSELTWIDHIITYRRTWTGTESKSQRGLLPRKLQWLLMSTYTKNNNKQTSRNQTRYGLYNLHLLISISRELTGFDPNRALIPGTKAVPIFLVYKMRPPPLNIKSCI